MSGGSVDSGRLIFFKRKEIVMEICNECGKSVARGHGLFVDRVPDLDDVEQRIDNGRPFPEGDWVCRECEEKWELEHEEELKKEME